MTDQSVGKDNKAWSLIEPQTPGGWNQWLIWRGCKRHLTSLSRNISSWIIGHRQRGLKADAAEDTAGAARWELQRFSRCRKVIYSLETIIIRPQVTVSEVEISVFSRYGLLLELGKPAVSPLLFSGEAGAEGPKHRIPARTAAGHRCRDLATGWLSDVPRTLPAQVETRPLTTNASTPRVFASRHGFPNKYLHINWQVGLCQCQTSYSSAARSWILSAPTEAAADAAAAAGGPPFWLTLQHTEKAERCQINTSTGNIWIRKRTHQNGFMAPTGCTLMEVLTSNGGYWIVIITYSSECTTARGVM